MAFNFDTPHEENFGPTKEQLAMDDAILKLHIPEELVDDTTAMDPTAEDLIYAQNLKENMVVLISAPTSRSDLDHLRAMEAIPNAAETANKLRVRAQINNRWCRVTQIYLTYREGYVDTVHFIGVYADGTKEVRSSPVHAGWLVKNYSNPVVAS